MKLDIFPTIKITSCFHWKSTLSRSYEKNVIVGDFHRANKISSDLENKISIINAKYLKAGYPNGFIDSINHYLKSRKKLVFRYDFVKKIKENETNYLQFRRLHIL